MLNRNVDSSFRLKEKLIVFYLLFIVFDKENSYFFSHLTVNIGLKFQSYFLAKFNAWSYSVSLRLGETAIMTKVLSLPKTLLEMFATRDESMPPL